MNMHSIRTCCPCSVAGAAFADTPQLGGTMLHLLVSQNGQTLELEYETL